jgi:IclR family pca regulon transcriptional regulator
MVPELRRLVSLFGDAASVGVMDGIDVLYIARVFEHSALRPLAGIGATHPAYATSMGRVLLSGLSLEKLDKYLALAKLDKFTEMTETSPNRLRKLIRVVRQQGYAATVDQLAYGITSLAVPIRLENKVVAAINTSGYTSRTTQDSMIDERLADLRLSAGRVASILASYPALLHSLMGNPSEPKGSTGSLGRKSKLS